MNVEARRRTAAFLFGSAVGAAAAMIVIWDQSFRHRDQLFSPRRYYRWAALGRLSAQPASVDACRLLRDFAAWEPGRILKARAMAILYRMEREMKGVESP